MWIRVTHANSGLPIDINLESGKHIYVNPSSDSTEIVGETNLVYTVRETPGQIWAAIAKERAARAAGVHSEFVQVAPVITLTKTGARRKR